MAALALGLALARVGPAQTAAELDSIKIAHKKFVLDNGLTLLVHEDHSVPAVSVNLWYHVGSRNEQRGKTGFAHLFEHFFFNGSQNYPHGFREAMDDLGANNRNGTTNSDRTNFFEDVPTSALERTLYLEADRMGFLAAQITAASLEREKGVVKNEKNLGENQPYGRSFTRVLGAMYPYSHPYSWSVIGRTEDLDAASLEDVRQWYRSFYGPNNCVLSLAGDVTPERALALVKKYFGSIPPSPPLERYRTWIPRLDRDIRDQMEDRVPQTRIYRAYHAPAWSDPEGVHLSLVAHALSGTKSSRLTRRLVYEKKLATAASAIYQPSEISGMFILVVTVRQGADPAEAEREMDAVMSGILTQGPTGEELERARASRIANFARSLERTGGFGGRSDVLAMSMIYGGKPDAYLDQFRTAASTTPAAVKQTAEKWLK
ncbi:MAG TPA: pitrilysin family protein, partial [Bryobacteraceae bacterium]|nr:pitrilysin family protein [Bryobacteraceae bacterium]